MDDGSRGACRRVVTLQVGGRSYRFATTAAGQELERMVQIVEGRIGEVSPGRGGSVEGVMLAALSLARDLEAERARSAALRSSAREMAARLLVQVRRALGEQEGPEESGDGPM